MVDGPTLLQEEINQVVKDGGNISHILRVEVLNLPKYYNHNEILEAVFYKIHEVPITHDISGLNVTIRWNSVITSDFLYYFTDVGGLLGHIAVKKHTQKLLDTILSELDITFDGIFTSGVARLSFIITRPLVKEIALIDDDD